MVDVLNNRDSFMNQVGLELKRAERYSIFVSLLLFDLSTIIKENDTSNEVIASILTRIAAQIREMDNAALVDDNKLALLFPETDRQGAEIASKRIVEAIKGQLKQLFDHEPNDIITAEMASYPDAAGAKSIKDFMAEYAENMKN